MSLASRALVLTAACAALAASPALAGPPWIAAEYPVNPHHQDTRGALLLVNAFHHGTPMQFPLTGRLEGVVDGKRQSMPVHIKPTYRPGVFAVRGEVPREGNWVLVVNLAGESKDKVEASLIAALGPRGEVLAVNVPAGAREGWTIPRAATTQDVDAALRTATAFARLAAADPQSDTRLAGIGLAGLLVAGASLLRRRRRRR